MTAKSMRSFAGGLIVAASVCSAIYFFAPSEATSTQTVSKPSVDEMKSELTNQGYVIHTEEEWNETLAAEKTASEDVKNEPKTETKEKIVYPRAPSAPDLTLAETPASPNQAFPVRPSSTTRTAGTRARSPSRPITDAGGSGVDKVSFPGLTESPAAATTRRARTRGSTTGPRAVARAPRPSSSTTTPA